MGHVKIGQTKNTVEGRLSELQTGNAFPLKVLKRITTPYYELNEFEFAFHDLFAKKRITTTQNSEWFNDSEYISELVKNLSSVDIRGYLRKIGVPKDDSTREKWLHEMEQKNKRHEMRMNQRWRWKQNERR